MAIPDREPPGDPAASRSSLWEAAAIGLGFLVVVAGVAWWLYRSPDPTPETGRSKFEKAEVDPNYARYAGDRSCRECHPGESAAHSRSGHSRTLRPAALVASARNLDGREVPDPELSGVAWRFAFRDGKLSTERREAGQVESFLVEYAFGSGRHAMTFVSLLDRDPANPSLIEHRLTSFAHAGDLGLTPGQKESSHSSGNTPHGRVQDGWNTLKCFSCHVTVTSNRGSSFLDEATMISNVSCERCHGPAKGHVEAARRGASGEELATSPRLGEATALEQMRFCGECHRTPEMITPGEIRVDNPALVRHQPVGLLQSACFLKAEGKLSCSTCHDPHARASTDRLSYQARCLECHGKPDQTNCSVSPLEGCVDCHMPRRDVGRGMMMSDHWIRVVRDPRP
jgi:Cytochrome c554 and c-prime